MTSLNVFEQLKLDKQQSEKMKELEEKRLALEEEDRKNIEDYRDTIDKMLDGKQQIDVKELSKLDAGIERTRQYNGEVSELARSLDMELQEAGLFFGDFNQYKGFWENNLAKWGWTSKADKMRRERFNKSDVKENLKTIIDYGVHITQKLQKAIFETMQCRTDIDGAIQFTADKLETNQPLYEKARGEKEAVERQYKEISDKFDQAQDSERAKLTKEKETLGRKLEELKATENFYFTIVDKARQAIPVQRVHRQAYSDQIDGLLQLQTGLKENIENVTQVYNAIPQAIKNALNTKGASSYDKGLKYATDKGTETVVAVAKGILDEAATRQERPLIEADRLDLYRKAMTDMEREFEQRVETLKGKHRAASVGN